jgi:hypothetical protein
MRSAIEINRKNLVIAGVSLIIYSLALVTIWELFYGVEAKGRMVLRFVLCNVQGYKQ